MGVSAEVLEAVAAATERYPSLSANGVKCRDQRPMESNQIATAIAYLRLCEPAKRTTLSSYSLKHRVEEWASTEDHRAYISNGALIVAAVYLGFPTSWKKLYGPNVGVAVRLSSLPETRR